MVQAVQHSNCLSIVPRPFAHVLASKRSGQRLKAFLPTPIHSMRCLPSQYQKSACAQIHSAAHPTLLVYCLYIERDRSYVIKSVFLLVLRYCRASTNAMCLCVCPCNLLMFELHIATDLFANTKCLSAGPSTLLMPGSHIVTVRASASSLFLLVFLYCLYFVSTLRKWSFCKHKDFRV